MILSIAPEGDSLEEFFQNIDEITDLIKKKWMQQALSCFGTQQTCSHIRVLSMVQLLQTMLMFLRIPAAQVKKGLDVSKKLGGENYVFLGWS